ncbi:glycosyltransferase family 4 protein [Curtobacterium sp. VKM Ac-1376]|uniref:glycosyltransferase family 4 protein n=1 Tax=Curtobacterium sp. VKM Ac-1376 TaxID=123312 RepID=UPI00188A7C33|nr:glycosyltransferase family 4 protein [Curtobacterium sp. VKM Ac-1376]MBF4614149.1 glycosyltransferase family 4 protein [Curtobacterium sp. VKM Ac-1376]
MTRLVFWLPAVNPYWRDRFNALAADGEVDFECWFNRHLDPDRSWDVHPQSMAFDHTFIGKSGDQHAWLFVHDLWSAYRRANPSTIFTFHHEPKLWPVWLHRLRGRNVALYALMTWDSWVKRSRVKEVAKRLFFSAATSVLTPGPQSDAYTAKYGAKNIYRLHHAVDVQRLGAASHERSASEALRLLYVGRMIKGKGVRMLTRALEPVLRGHPSVSVRFVGDGPLRQELEEWAERTGPQVEVSAFIQSEGMADVYSAADVLLFPTEGDPYGLVVDEALAAGVPVVSSDCAGDIAWRLEGGRGWVLPVGDEVAWTRLLNQIATDRGQLAGMSANALKFSAGHGVDRWVAELKTWLEVSENDGYKDRELH